MKLYTIASKQNENKLLTISVNRCGDGYDYEFKNPLTSDDLLDENLVILSTFEKVKEFINEDIHSSYITSEDCVIKEVVVNINS